MQQGKESLFICVFSLFFFLFLTSLPLRKKIPAEITMLLCKALKNTYRFDLDIHKGGKVIYIYF